MRRIIIKSGNTQAIVLPDFGGMVSSLSVDGTEVLRMNEGNLGIANCLAGGIPVLFPFCSKTENDTYFVSKKSYTMPMHGFVKDMPFSVENQTEDSVTVYTLSNKVIKQEWYPFDFILHIEYKVTPGALNISAKIDNLSQERMPFYIGWHTYFKTSSKKSTKFTFNFKEFTSYLDGKKGSVQSNTLDLSQPLDHVYKGIGNREMVLENYADGYIATTIADDMHEVLTVCTAFDDCACIEPWTAVPNAINTGEMLRYAEQGSSVICGFEIKIKKL